MINKIILGQNIVYNKKNSLVLNISKFSDQEIVYYEDITYRIVSIVKTHDFYEVEYINGKVYTYRHDKIAFNADDMYVNIAYPTANGSHEQSGTSKLNVFSGINKPFKRIFYNNELYTEKDVVLFQKIGFAKLFLNNDKYILCIIDNIDNDSIYLKNFQ